MMMMKKMRIPIEKRRSYDTVYSLDNQLSLLIFFNAKVIENKFVDSDPKFMDLLPYMKKMTQISLWKAIFAWLTSNSLHVIPFT